MTILAVEPRSDPLFEAAAPPPSSRRAALGASAGAALDSSLTALVFREFRRDVNALDHLARGTGENLSAAEANSRYGIDGARVFKHPISADAAAERQDLKKRELARQDLLRRNRGGGLQKLGVSLAASFLDPLGVAVTLIPGIGTEIKGAQVARSAFSLSRFAQRAAAGAREGVLAGAAVEIPIDFLASQREGQQRSAGDMLLNIAISGGLGALARPLFGLALNAARTGAAPGKAAARGAVPERRASLPDEALAADAQTRQMAFTAAVAEVANGDTVHTPGDILNANAQARAAALGPPGPDIAAHPVREDVAIDAAGARTPVRYAIVSLDDLTPSHRDDFSINPDFPAILQPRQRARAASQLQVREIAANLQPELLGEAPQAQSGAPVIAADGVVESGNGRVLALRQVYGAGGDAQARYQAFLQAHDYPVQGVKKPVLVRIADPARDAHERLRFVRAANSRDTADLSVTEQAMADAGSLRPELLALHEGGAVTLARNAPFRRVLVEAMIPPAERGSLLTADGGLSQAGARRLEAAIAGFAYEDAPLIATVLESADEHMRGIGRALIDAAPAWAQMRAAVKSGQMNAGFDLTAALLDAVHVVRHARAARRNVAEFVGQRDMFSAPLSAEATFFLRLFFRKSDFTGARAAAKITGDLRFLAAELQKAKPGPDLFGEVRHAPELDLIAGALARRSKGTLFDQGQNAGAPGQTIGIGGDGQGGQNLQGAGRGAGGGQDRAAGAGLKKRAAGDGDGDGIANEKQLARDPELLMLSQDDVALDAQVQELTRQGLIDKKTLREIERGGLNAEQKDKLGEMLRAAAFCLENGGG